MSRSSRHPDLSIPLSLAMGAGEEHGWKHVSQDVLIQVAIQGGALEEKSSNSCGKGGTPL